MALQFDHFQKMFVCPTVVAYLTTRYLITEQVGFTENLNFSCECQISMIGLYSKLSVFYILWFESEIRDDDIIEHKSILEKILF